ncbi:LysR family transcriptional regulator [Brucella sp. C7-11G]
MAEISLRQMELFRAVMRTGSLTAAAHALGITQPAASRLLRHAEDQLKMPLFERLNRGLKPTPEANALFPEIDRVFSEVENVQRLASDLPRLRAGRLHIAAIPSLATAMVAPVLAKFVRNHPAVTITTSAAMNFEIPGQVLSGRADLGLGFLPLLEPGLVLEELTRTEIVAVLPAKHPLSKHSRINPSQLAGSPLISFSSAQPIGRWIDDWFRNKGIRQAMAVEVNASYIACAYVCANAGIALVDRFAAESWVHHDLVVRSLDPVLPLSSVIVMPMDRKLSLLALAFTEALRLQSR